jgi:hypothetical protein
MAIVASDIEFRYSVATGSAGNSTAQAVPGDSLGKYMSTTQLTASLHDLFDVVSGAENAASDVEYRCIFVFNNHATLTWEGATAWISAEGAGGCDIALAADGIGSTPKGQAGAQAEEEADESTGPTGETFSSPTSKGTGIVLGDIVAGNCYAIWVRRTAANTAAVDADSFTLSVEGDTAA